MSEEPETIPAAILRHQQDIRRTIAVSSRISSPYLVMNALATVVAAYGLLANSTAVVIGAMIIATAFTSIADLFPDTAQIVLKASERTAPNTLSKLTLAGNLSSASTVAAWSANDLHEIKRHIRNRPCPVTSRIRPRCSIHPRFLWTAARLAPVRASAIGAETKGHSVSARRRAGGVFPESGVISASARTDHASISSRCRIAVRHATSIPWSQRAKRSAGGPTACSPPAPPSAKGAKMAPLPSLAAMRAAVTTASIRSPCCPRPARLQRW